MKRWKRHAVYICIVTVISQILGSLIYDYAPDLFIQFIILTMSTNLIALIYAIIAFKSYEESSEKLGKDEALQAGLQVLRTLGTSIQKKQR
jgi:putative effector of murein hydrolase